MCNFRIAVSSQSRKKSDIHATLTHNFRRAHPSGFTIGEYLRKELSDKVGGADVFVGLPHKGRQHAPKTPGLQASSENVIRLITFQSILGSGI